MRRNPEWGVWKASQSHPELQLRAGEDLIRRTGFVEKASVNPDLVDAATASVKVGILLDQYAQFALLTAAASNPA